jgi:protein Tob/BTG
MQKEVDSAVRFICGLLRARSLSLDLLETFSTVLCQVMYGRYQDHWFPDKPRKGCAYRCMRINDRIIDPLILLAATTSGLTESELLPLLPSQLTIWVDPEEVAYRIGEDGSIGVIYDAHAPPLDVCASPGGDSDGDTAPSSVETSPSSSPVPGGSSDEDALPPRCVLSLGASCRQELAAGGTKAGGVVGGQAPSRAGQYFGSVLIASS